MAAIGHGKGQISIEFITFVGIVLFIVLIASFAAISTGNDVKAENEFMEARKFTAKIAQEVNIAVEIGTGYFHNFNMPELFSTATNYSVNTTETGFVAVEWDNKTYSLPVLTGNITGAVKKGKNTIRNTNGVISFE
jgi:hypothetical protein